MQEKISLIIKSISIILAIAMILNFILLIIRYIKTSTFWYITAGIAILTFLIPKLRKHLSN